MTTATAKQYRSGWCDPATAAHGRCAGQYGAPGPTVDCLCPCHTEARATKDAQARDDAEHAEQAAAEADRIRAALEAEEAFVEEVAGNLPDVILDGDMAVDAARAVIAAVREHDLGQVTE